MSDLERAQEWRVRQLRADHCWCIVHNPDTDEHNSMPNPQTARPDDRGWLKREADRARSRISRLPAWARPGMVP